MTRARAVILDAVLAVVRLRLPETTEVRDDQQLVGELGLASLDLAELGATIEVKLGHPVFDGVAMQGFVTVGDLVEHCEQALAVAAS